MDNPTLETIRRRRSVRKFKPEQITEEELSLIVEAGRYAPSGSNSQLTHLIVIQNAAVLAELRALVQQEFAAMEPDEGMYKSFANAIAKSKQGTYSFLYSAPTLVVVANRKDHGNNMADSAACIENMMLAATSLGVGSCWINQLRWLRENERVVAFLEKLGLSPDETVCGGVVLGYSAQGELAPPARSGNPVTIVR